MWIPKDLVIPFPYDPKPVSFEEWAPVRIYIPTKLSPRFETVDWFRAIETPEDLAISLEQMPRHSITICDPGAFDALLRVFPDHIIQRLYYGGRVKIGDWKLKYRGTNISLSRGRSDRRYLWNIHGFLNLDEDLECPWIEQIWEWGNILLSYLNEMGLEPSDLSSPSSLGRAMLLRVARWEFKSRHIPWQILDDFCASVYGNRQECNGIGAIDAHNYDMNKAHLTIFSQLPGIGGCQYFRDFDYIQETTYGAYEIIVDVPKMDFCPLPVRINTGFAAELAYPYGTVAGWFPKPYIDLLHELSITYKLLRSHQFVPTKPNRRPFSSLTKILWKIIDNPPVWLNPKSLYYGLAGSTISWRPQYMGDKDEELTPKAYPVFSPMIYSHVLASQTVRVFRELDKDGAVAIRADAVTTRDSIDTTLNFESSGKTVFVTPLYKSFPSGKGVPWAEHIERYRDKPYVDYQYEAYPRLKVFLETGIPLGKIRQANIRVKPNHGLRNGEVPDTVGELLDNWFPSSPFEISELV